MPIRSLKASLADLVREAFPELEAVPEEVFSTPPNPELGDLCLQAFPLAKLLRRSPQEIAQQIGAALQEAPGLQQATAMGPYVNCFLDLGAFARDLLAAVEEEGEGFGRTQTGAGHKVLIEYSSPNIAKPFGIGHLRSTVIGAALYRLYDACGYESITLNHLGDWGTQFGLLMVAFEESGEEELLQADPLGYLYRLYVEYSNRREEDEDLAQRARDWFRRLEEGDARAVELWEKFRDLSLREFERVYERLGVRFDHVRGESWYQDKMAPVLEQLQAAGLAEVDDGASIVDLSDRNMPPAMLVKSDGGSTYLLRDLAAAESRAAEFGFYLCLYVIGSPQALHMQQVKAVLEKLGRPWADRLLHINFGHILGMKTREGTLIFLDQVLDEAVERSRQAWTGTPWPKR
jgi:arginyl-tRNA synthetase